MVKINSVSIGTNDSGLNEQQQKWWDEISTTPIDIYGLSDKLVKDFARPLNLDKNAIYLVVSAPAATPAIELAVGQLFEIEKTYRIRIPKYSFSTVDKYLVIKPSEGDIILGPSGKPIFVPST